MIEKLVVFLPLIGAIIAGVIVFMPTDDKKKKHQRDVFAQVFTCAGLALSALCAISVFFDVSLGGNPKTIELFTLERNSSSFSLSLFCLDKKPKKKNFELKPETETAAVTAETPGMGITFIFFS